MALQMGFPSENAATTHAAARRDLAGLVAMDYRGNIKPGVMFHVGTSLVSARSDMRLDVKPFNAVLDKQGACFVSNDAVMQTPAFAAAPTTGKRIDLLYLTQELNSIDGTTEVKFGIIKGTPSTSPTAPSLPAALQDALPFATVEIPAGATSTNSSGVVITKVYPYSSTRGGVIVMNTVDDMNAYPASTGTIVFNYETNQLHLRRTGEWVIVGPQDVPVYGHYGKTDGFQPLGSNFTEVKLGNLAISSGGVTKSGNGLRIPVDGIYQITAGFYTTGNQGYTAHGAIIVNGGAISYTSSWKGDAQDIRFCRTILYPLKQGDIVTMRQSAGTTWGSGSGYEGAYLEILKIG